MISNKYWQKIKYQTKNAEVWISDPLGETSIKIDRYCLCSQINAIPKEVLEQIKVKIEETSDMFNSAYEMKKKILSIIDKY